METGIAHDSRGQLVLHIQFFNSTGMYLNAFPENSGLGKSFKGSICSSSESSQFLLKEKFKCVSLGLLAGNRVDVYIQ